MSGSSSTTSTRLAMPGPSYQRRVSPISQDPGAIGPEAPARRLRPHALGRLAERLLGEVEGAPVDAQQHARADVLGGLHRLLGRHVHGAHDRRAA